MVNEPYPLIHNESIYKQVQSNPCSEVLAFNIEMHNKLLKF
jgi:hypothetical protein